MRGESVRLGDRVIVRIDRHDGSTPTEESCDVLVVLSGDDPITGQSRDGWLIVKTSFRSMWLAYSEEWRIDSSPMVCP